MAKRSKSTFSPCAITLFVVLVVGGYYLYKSSLQTAQVAQVVEQVSDETVIVAQTPVSNETPMGNMTMSAAGTAIKPQVTSSGMLTTTVNRNAPLTFAKSTPNFTYDKNKYYTLDITGGLTDGKGITMEEESPSKESTAKWTVNFKDARGKIIATSKGFSSVWANSDKPLDHTRVEFVPPARKNKQAPQNVAIIEVVLDKSSIPMALNIAEIKLATKTNPYIPTPYVNQ